MLLIIRHLHINKIFRVAILIAGVSILFCLPANAQKSKKQLSKEKSKSKSFDWQEKSFLLPFLSNLFSALRILLKILT